MNRADMVRMCLAEAGFVEGRDFTELTTNEAGGWRIHWGREHDTTELLAAVLKAGSMVAKVNDHPVS